MDSRERTRPRALLLLAGTGAGAALGTWQDAARGDEDYVAVGELLLKFTGQAMGVISLGSASL